MIFIKTIETRQSPINGTIKVISYLGQPRIEVDGYTQSGGLIVKLWRQSLKTINQILPDTPTALVLGFAGGTIAQELWRIRPLASIVGVDLDPIMLEVGAHYFPLQSSVTPSQLKLRRQDAKRWLARDTNHYDLIVVDLYQGETIPTFVYQPSFHRQLKRHLSPSGIVLINHIAFSPPQIQLAQSLLHQLNQLFKHSRVINTTYNQIFACSDDNA